MRPVLRNSSVTHHYAELPDPELARVPLCDSNAVFLQLKIKRDSG